MIEAGARLETRSELGAALQADALREQRLGGAAARHGPR